MRLFITGASGFIGSAVVPELLQAGHQVVGLARSDASAEAIAALGAGVVRGDLTERDTLRDAARESEGVIHLGFIHDYTNFAESIAVDRRAIETFCEALEGTDRPLLVASGVLGMTSGRPVTERDLAPEDPNGMVAPRHASAALARSFVPRGVRTVIVRFAPTVHGPGDHGFIDRIVGIARERGVSGYIGDGSNRWSAVHRLDAARLVRLATEAAPAGTIVHAIGEEGVPTRDIAEAIGRGLDLPVASIAAERAGDHFGFMGMVLGANAAAANAVTRELLGWEPTQPGLIEDLALGHYFESHARTAGAR
jgi:nucleoside-diphosphate-sugar epimerase